MRMLLTTGLLAAAAAIAAPAYAAPTIVFTQNNFALTEPGAAVLFNGFNSAAGSSDGVAYTGTPTPGVAEVITPVVNVFSNGTVDPGTSVDPSIGASLGNYLSIGTQGSSLSSYSIAFATPVRFLSFVLGSIDSYNTVTLNYSDGSAATTLSGRQIIGESDVGPRNNSIQGRVNYFFGDNPALASVTFASSDTAFEIDEIATAVPEPASWAMMIFGFGAVGGALRSARRRKTTVAFA